MKLKSLAFCLAATTLATGAAAFLTSCQSTGPHHGPHRSPGQVIRETHQRNMARHRSFHEKMADRHERTFGVRPPTPPMFRRSGSYGY